MIKAVARDFSRRIPKGLWRILVGVTGFAVIAAGMTLLVLPGPGLLVILLGLAILATEFRWARRLLNRALAWVKKSRERLTKARNARRRAT